jgi:hypothetical protein
MTINNEKYKKTELCKNLAYVLEYHELTKDYYLLNRDYEYIGYDNIFTLEKLGETITSGWKRIYLYDTDTKPWEGKKKLISYIKKYETERQTLSLNQHKNSNLYDFDWFIY